MAIFTYIASGKDGDIAEGEMEAKDQSTVIAYLEKREYFPLSIKEKKRKTQLLSISFGSHLSLLDKVILTRNLALMIKAGIGLSEAVDIILEDAEKPTLRKVLTRAKADLEKGLQLSDALAQFPKNFPPVFINLLRAGEASGNLEESLLQIATHMKKENDLRKKVKSAMAYPTILLSLAFGVIALLVTVVLPRVSKVFAQANVELPLLTRILIKISDLVAGNWFVALLAVGLIIFGLSVARKSATGRWFLQALARHIPVVRTLIQKVVLAQFATTMHSLLKAGVPIIRALEITSNSLSNITYQRLLISMSQSEVSKGVSLGMALKRRPDYFPHLMSNMIVIGEKSGNLENMLENLASFYEEEVDNSLKTFITVLEPLLLLGIGLIIGVLALSIVMPIYQMISTVR